MHTTVLPVDKGRRQQVEHVWVDGAAGLMTTWQQHDGAWWAYCFWSTGDGSMYQGWVPSNRVARVDD